MKKKLDKEMELLEATGAEGKTGVKAAKEVFALKEKKAKEAEQAEINRLELNKRSKFAYNIFLAEALQKRLADIDFPDNWKIKVAPTEVGVVMEIETPGPRFFRSAFKSTGEGYYDINAINNYAVRADALIDRIPNSKKTQGGIYLQ